MVRPAEDGTWALPLATNHDVEVRGGAHSRAGARVHAYAAGGRVEGGSPRLFSCVLGCSDGGDPRCVDRLLLCAGAAAAGRSGL